MQSLKNFSDTGGGFFSNTWIENAKNLNLDMSERNFVRFRDIAQEKVQVLILGEVDMALFLHFSITKSIANYLRERQIKDQKKRIASQIKLSGQLSVLKKGQILPFPYTYNFKTFFLIKGNTYYNSGQQLGV